MAIAIRNSFEDVYRGCKNITTHPDNIFANVDPDNVTSFKYTFYENNLTVNDLPQINHLTNIKECMYTFGYMSKLKLVPDYYLISNYSEGTVHIDGMFEGCFRLFVDNNILAGTAYFCVAGSLNYCNSHYFSGEEDENIFSNVSYDTDYDNRSLVNTNGIQIQVKSTIPLPGVYDEIQYEFVGIIPNINILEFRYNEEDPSFIESTDWAIEGGFVNVLTSAGLLISETPDMLSTFDINKSLTTDEYNAITSGGNVLVYYAFCVRFDYYFSLEIWNDPVQKLAVRDQIVQDCITNPNVTVGFQRGINSIAGLFESTGLVYTPTIFACPDAATFDVSRLYKNCVYIQKPDQRLATAPNGYYDINSGMFRIAISGINVRYGRIVGDSIYEGCTGMTYSQGVSSTGFTFPHKMFGTPNLNLSNVYLQDLVTQGKLNATYAEIPPIPNSLYAAFRLCTNLIRVGELLPTEAQQESGSWYNDLQFSMDEIFYGDTNLQKVDFFEKTLAQIQVNMAQPISMKKALYDCNSLIDVYPNWYGWVGASGTSHDPWIIDGWMCFLGDDQANGFNGVPFYWGGIKDFMNVYFEMDIGNATDVTYTVTHNLYLTKNAMVQLIRNDTGLYVNAAITRVDNQSYTITFDTPPGTVLDPSDSVTKGAIHVIIFGISTI